MLCYSSRSLKSESLKPSNIIHPTLFKEFGFGNDCLGRVMMSVSTILLLKLTRLFGSKVKEGLFTRNT